MTDAPKPDAWRYLSNAKGAKWTVQKNYPDQVAKWPGYTVEPLYSEAVLTSLREEVAELRKERGQLLGLRDTDGAKSDVPDPHYPAAHSRAFRDGYRRGSRDAMAWLQRRAARMCVGASYAVLCSAVTNMGWAFARARTALKARQ